MSTVDHPVMLIVLDGWGYSEKPRFNAIETAEKPTWDRIWRDYPHELIRCSGPDVGLPDEQMGNSEVGHMHIGAGRTVNQDYTRICGEISDGAFFENDVLKTAFEKAANNDKAVHILGLASPGGVHSHEEHVLALVDLAAGCGVTQAYVHAFLDGRDTPPRSARASLERIDGHCRELKIGGIASIVGRYFAMDRNANWERTEVAYNLVVDGAAQYVNSDVLDALNEAYARGENDEFVSPTAIADASGATQKIADGDVVVFANFRSDRARQLTRAFVEQGFTEFERARDVRLEEFISMTSYGAQFSIPVAYPPIDLNNTFGHWIAAQGLKQLRIAETEKYAHVTFFFNGGVELVEPGEDRILIDSPDVATYDLKPEMSAPAVTDALVDAIAARRYDAIVCNYANADMVGHTGDFDATVRCIEALDRCLGRVIEAAQAHGMEILITADHGNAEQMRAADDSGAEQAHTAHTSNVVPLIYIGRPAMLAANGCLSDLAPTMLSLMDLPIPDEMTGRSLVVVQGGKQVAA